MHRRPIAVLFVVGAASLLGIARTATARTVRLSCHDGVSPPRTLCPVGCSGPNLCDADDQCDGICTFAIRVCPEVTCEPQTVPVGQKVVVPFPALRPGAKPTRFVLRCLPHPSSVPCPVPTTSPASTTTTTTL